MSPSWAWIFPAKPIMYFPLSRLPSGQPYAVALGAGAPAALAQTLQRELSAVDADLAFYDVKPMEQILSEAVGGRRFSMLLLGLFAALALLLAAIGIYGVVSYSVSQRTREIGVRMAIGAGEGRVLRMVLGETLKVVGTGIVLGAAGALALSRVIASQLYDTHPFDPLVFLGVSALLASTALLSSWIPARRAARIPPTEALRAE